MICFILNTNTKKTDVFSGFDAIEENVSVKFCKINIQDYKVAIFFDFFKGNLHLVQIYTKYIMKIKLKFDQNLEINRFCQNVEKYLTSYFNLLGAFNF